MEFGIRKTPSRLCPQDSRFRFYGGTMYGSVHWVPLDPGTNPPHRRQEGLETAVDHFSRLPDHVIVHHVFDKMPDLKTLFNVSLVSKHFASLVFGVQAVSLKLANWAPTACPGTFLSRARKHILNLLSKLFRPAYPINFLKKFSCIRSLSIDLSYKGIAASGLGFDQRLLRWRFDKNGFVLLLAENREVGVDGEDTVVVGDDEETAVDVWNSIEYHLFDGFFRLAVAAFLLEGIPHLSSVSVRDCLGRGRVEMDEEFICDVGSASDNAENEPSCVKVWRLRAVKLPGCVMKDVTLCVVKDDGVDDGLLVENAFGDDREFGELARKILKEEANIRGKISIV